MKRLLTAAAIFNRVGERCGRTGRGSRSNLVQKVWLCVPKTLSVLMTPRNHLSWRNDRATVFRRGGLGLTIQVEDPA